MIINIAMIEKLYIKTNERNYWTEIYDKIVNGNIESWVYSNQLCNCI